ncbi:LytR/AlgR family response regulator transcription factor [Aquibacillus sediminis]|uniref:LytR/AlgR family response regulator transcription factor n=1 Tax=Aquibacillus sediminis TaxID=2574734 RepID=UPI00110863E1|nr:LytTR family DNA-binding domain-containing protein [Aquibacillus sediminis]
MGQLSVIVAERHPYSIGRLIKDAESYLEMTVIGQVQEEEELVKQTTLYQPDLLIVDTNISSKDVLSTVNKCLSFHPSLKVIFVTVSTEYAVQAFSIDAIDYIVKPYKNERLFRAIHQAKHCIQSQNSHQRDHSKRLYIRQGAIHHYIPKEEILFLEKTKHKVFIHSTNQIYETQETLTYYLDILDDDFYRSHRSYIINLSNLSRIEPSGHTFLAYFQQYDRPAFISKTQLNNIKQQMHIFK